MMSEKSKRAFRGSQAMSNGGFLKCSGKLDDKMNASVNFEKGNRIIGNDNEWDMRLKNYKCRANAYNYKFTLLYLFIICPLFFLFFVPYYYYGLVWLIMSSIVIIPISLIGIISRLSIDYIMGIYDNGIQLTVDYFIPYSEIISINTKSGKWILSEDIIILNLKYSIDIPRLVFVERKRKWRIPFILLDSEGLTILQDKISGEHKFTRKSD